MTAPTDDKPMVSANPTDGKPMEILKPMGVASQRNGDKRRAAGEVARGAVGLSTVMATTVTKEKPTAEDRGDDGGGAQTRPSDGAEGEAGPMPSEVGCVEPLVQSSDEKEAGEKDASAQVVVEVEARGEGSHGAIVEEPRPSDSEVGKDDNGWSVNGEDQTGRYGVTMAVNDEDGVASAAYTIGDVMMDGEVEWQPGEEVEMVVVGKPTGQPKGDEPEGAAG
ncbi:unnamed protein product [Peronospora belbahrii]|uniref:Uncharacterized protein n=1 Tax=Peronospora belbahrii TaxID=622444 RepID=A0AAU9KR96_9STRA|nr:unnamed protein product [Peronospora belbahrii]CAH0476886.1 unnamed protein product [Peronospora belbahrii]CAH0517717.1 unnamed protein product [Peronospora belbahrii]